MQAHAALACRLHLGHLAETPAHLFDHGAGVRIVELDYDVLERFEGFAVRAGLPEASWDGPLRHSGLALAGANLALEEGLDQGLVIAEKLVGLDLRGTELVVLSACETGLGDVRRGEGVFGLERAFLLAGARSLVMSLWPVSDESTRRLMTGFYSRWASGLSKSEALRQARLELRGHSDNPAVWGAFILVGNPE